MVMNSVFTNVLCDQLNHQIGTWSSAILDLVSSDLVDITASTSGDQSTATTQRSSPDPAVSAWQV